MACQLLWNKRSGSIQQWMQQMQHWARVNFEKKIHTILLGLFVPFIITELIHVELCTEKYEFFPYDKLGITYMWPVVYDPLRKIVSFVKRRWNFLLQSLGLIKLRKIPGWKNYIIIFLVIEKGIPRAFPDILWSLTSFCWRRISSKIKGENPKDDDYVVGWLRGRVTTVYFPFLIIKTRKIMDI